MRVIKAVLPVLLSSTVQQDLMSFSRPYLLTIFPLSDVPTLHALTPPCSLHCTVSASSIYSVVHARSQGPGMERRRSHLQPYLRFPGECCGHFLMYSLCISKTLLRGAGYRRANLPKQLKPGPGCRCYQRTMFGLERDTCDGSSPAHLVFCPCKASIWTRQAVF